MALVEQLAWRSDVDRCAQERVEIIGSIQPHGVLLALSELDFVVQQISANASTFFRKPRETILDSSFEAILGTVQFEAFRRRLSEGEGLGGTLLHPSAGSDEVEWSAHRQGGVLIVELEPVKGAHSLEPLSFDAHVRTPLSRLRAASDVAELSQVAAAEVRRLSGFGRVLIYRFDEEWNGEVIAEAAGPSPVSYYGLRFPAGDIPPQVRQLFLLNAMRAIADIDAVPSPLVTTNFLSVGRPLDLTYSLLRSASPIHLEYLRNMGVHASLTVSILVEGRLWGMIACHHPSPHRVARSARSVCELIGQTLAAELASRLDTSALGARVASRSRLDAAMAAIEASESLLQGLESENGRLLALFDADGLVSRFDGALRFHGTVAEPDALAALTANLRNRASAGVASSDQLGTLDAGFAPHLKLISGALYIGLSEITGDYLLLLRQELVETIAWAGNPNKSVLEDEHGRLHPRKSFEAWRQTVHGVSRAWTQVQIETARYVRDQILRLQGARELAILNQSLQTQIAERKRTELALREAERKYRGMFDEALVGIFNLSADGRLINVNPAMARYLGYDSSEEMLSTMKDPLWSTSVSPQRTGAFMEAMQTAGFVKSFEMEVFRRDKDRIWISSSVRATVVDGVVVQYVGMFEDITEHRQLREHLAQAQKLESVGQLAAGIAHEINTPVQYIGDNVRFLKDSFEDLVNLHAQYQRLMKAARIAEITPQLVDDASTAEKRVDVDYLLREVPIAIEQTLEGISRVSVLVGAMKEFSHPGNGEKIPTDLNHAIESTATVARNEWKYVSELKLDLDVTLPLVACLTGEMSQVLLNLIVNAAHAIEDFAADGGPERGVITIRSHNRTKYVEVQIQDTGAGIPEHIRTRIFDPFFTTKEIGKGTGQG